MSPTEPDSGHEDIAVLVQDLDVRRGSKRVLRGISLRVRRGVVTGLLGPSGSGKTTLIRAIVGVQIVHAGEVKVLGRPAGAPGLRRRVAYVTQAPSVYADLTVRENQCRAEQLLSDTGSENLDQAFIAMAEPA